MSPTLAKRDGTGERSKNSSISPVQRDTTSMNGGASTMRNHQEQDPESDVDELVDSDADDAPNGTAKPSTGRVGRPKGSKTKKTNNGAANGNGNGNGAHERHRSEVDARYRVAKDGSSSRPTSKPASRRASPAARGPTAPLEPVPSLPTDASKSYNGPSSSSSAAATSSSREMLGRTATGGPVPYYYPQSHSAADTNRSSQSPQDLMYGKSKPLAGKPIDAPASELEDLTGQEVDKFLDLIEKYNLDTSNEDDMARSVTELYQEWLEWCAKRNVVSTKSKQALVGEFVRIHHGAYGPIRQQRAMEIVQGSRTFSSAGSANAALDRAAGGSSSRALPRGQAMPLTALRDLDKNGRARNHDARNSPPRAMMPRPASPAAAGLRPHSPGYDDPFARGIPPAILDSIHQQIRDEVLREAGAMVQQILHENLGELVAENQGMARRIEQLELHSDNLAQWVQHLNRVQEDTAAAAAVQQGPMPIREEIIDDGRMPREAFRGGPPPRDGYGPGPGPAYRHGSPKRSYGGGMAPRASMSPAMTHRSGGRPPGPPAHHMVPHDAYDRPGGPPAAMGMAGHMPPSGGVPGPPPPPNHGAGFRGASPRSAHAYAASAAHGGGGGPMPPPHMYNDGMVGGGPPPPPGAVDGRGGGYYNGPAFDERGGPMPPPPPGSGPHPYDHHGPMHPAHPASPPRQMKRARNGY